MKMLDALFSALERRENRRLKKILSDYEAREATAQERINAARADADKRCEDRQSWINRCMRVEAALAEARGEYDYLKDVKHDTPSR